MFQLAVYGKGGIGKSTMSANISFVLAGRGHRVMQIGCDPKHDSTRLLLGGGGQRTVLDYVRDVPEPQRMLSDIMVEGSGGVLCIESGGPEPGIGCAGRGILTAFDTVRRLGADSVGADVRVYDVLGDVVCGGFAVPLREENADGIVIVTSGEFMALYAANNIMKGIRRFTPGKPRLIGLILNSRGVEGEAETVRRFADATGTRIIGIVPRDRTYASAEAEGHPVCEMIPESDAAEAVRGIVGRIEDSMVGGRMDSPHPLDDDQMSDLAAGREIRPSSRVSADIQVCNGCDVTGWSRRQKYSCASCGALMAFARLSDTAVVVHGPASCSYLMDSAYLSTVADLYAGGVYDTPMPDNIYSSRMDEGSAIFGGTTKLSCALEAAASDGFQEMAVITTCVSGMIGDDCDAVARGFEASHPGARVQVLHTDGVMAGDYFEGMEGSVSELIGAIDPDVRMEDGLVNIVGTTFFDLQTPEASKEIDRMLSLFGMRVNCRFLDDTTMSSVRGFCRASVDLLLNETRADGMLDRIRSSTGRDAPVMRIPTGIDEYVGWLRRMGEITGMADVASREEECARDEYARFVERNRGRFQGLRVAVSTCIERNVDWFLDMLDDLGAVVVRLGYLKPEGDPGIVTVRHRDMLTYGYGKEMMMRDWERLRPDLLVFDVDVPDGYPGRDARMTRIGPGIRPAMRFVESLAEVLETCGEAAR